MTSIPAPLVKIYTDGGCRGNPGPGAWAAILVADRHSRTLAGAALRTTNNQMELTAAIEALAALKKPCRVHFVSDSEYLIKGITQWIHGWERRGWQTAAKEPVKNQKLWQALSHLVSRHEVRWTWTRGHAGHAKNEECDQLANELMDRLMAGESADSLKIDDRSGESGIAP